MASFKHFSLLLKKQIQDSLPSFNKKRSLRENLSSTLLMVVLIGGIIALFGLIFSRFVDTYTAIKINRVPDIASRQFELMSIAYFALIVVFLFHGINQLCYTLFENSDLNILLSMPFSSTELFLSRLVSLYIKQALIATVSVVAINYTFFISTSTLDAYNGVMTFVIAPLLPLIPLTIASIIVLPFYYVKRLLNSHYIFVFTVLTLAMALFCVGYSYIFRFAETILNSGKIAALFNESVMNGIQGFAKYSYPANLFASIMLRRDVGKSIGILVAICVPAIVICFFVVRALFIKVSQARMSTHVPHTPSKKLTMKKRTRTASLLQKEFLLVLRTPNYAFMYLSIAATMPVLAFYSAKLATGLINSLFGNVNLEFELCTLITVLYSSLTNTFCSTNISRDGTMAMTLKTMPYAPKQILQVKVLFCSIVSVTSIMITCILYGALSLQTPLNAFVTFISATMVALAQVLIATRMDLNNPHFSKTDEGEIKEANSTVSSIILLGLVQSLLMGVLMFISPVVGLINGSADGFNKSVSYAVAICLPIAILVGGIVFFLVNLQKKYDNLDVEAKR